MAYYEIPPPYEGNHWDHHYLCLWEVRPDEMVGIWSWADLRAEIDWFEKIIMPAVERYRENRRLKKGKHATAQRDEFWLPGIVASCSVSYPMSLTCA